jgi:hypothetical protein
MRKYLRLFLASCTFLFALAAVGCNGGSPSESGGPKPPTATAPAITTTSLPPADVGTAYSATLEATGGTGAYTWSVSTGTLPAWAILDSASGTISGMPDTAATSNFSVKVTDQAGHASAGRPLSLSVNPALAVSTTSLPNGTVKVPYAMKLDALWGLPPYIWSLSSGSLPSWAVLNPATGVISGIPDAVGTSSFTVEVTDSYASPRSAAQELSATISAANSIKNAELNGQYAFLLQGFDDASGNQFGIVGSFTADGKGNITGLEDINGPGGYKSEVSFTGTYSLGPDDRGFATFTNSSGAATSFALAVGSLNSSQVAEKASLAEFDDITGTTGRRGSGFALMQDLNAFQLESIAGPYAFQFVGQTEKPASRLVLTGAFIADGKGNVTNGQFDTNVDGATPPPPQDFTAAISAGAQTSSSGRVTTTVTTISVPHFVFYVVSAGRMLAMSTDQESTSGLLAGEVLAQASNSFSNASLKGTSVGYSQGLSPVFSREDSSAGAGLWTFDGSGSVSFSVDWAEGWLGWDLLGDQTTPSTGTRSYSVSPNGRVTISAGFTMPNPILYLVDTNKGFSMSMDAETTAGFLEPQTGGPFSNASLSGNYFLGTMAPAVACSGVASGIGTSAADGTLNLVLDQNDPKRLINASQKLSMGVTIDPTGRGPDHPLRPAVIVYVISPTKAVFLPDPAEDCPTVAILEQ